MRLRQRVRKLEDRIIGGQITCYMADGSERRVRASRLLEMVYEVGRAEMKEDTRTVFECVRDNCLETGNGFMGELIRVMGLARQSTARLSPEEQAQLDGSDPIGTMDYTCGSSAQRAEAKSLLNQSELRTSRSG